MAPSNGGWKYVSIIVSVALLAAGAVGAKLWEIGVSSTSRTELSQTVERHGKDDAEKFSMIMSRVSTLEALQETRTARLYSMEAQTAVLDAMLKELRKQHDDFRTEMRRDISDIKALLRSHAGALK